MGDSRTQQLLRILIAPLVDLEAAAMAVLTQRSIDNAVGAQLTVLGKIVGRDSRHPDDEIERRLSRAQISTNKSDGLIEDILTVARLVVDDEAATMVIDNTGNAGFVLYVEGIALDDSVARVLVKLEMKAKSAAVALSVVWSPSPPTDVLRWDANEWDTHVWASAADKEF